MTDLCLRFKEPRPLGRLLNQPGELIGVDLTEVLDHASFHCPCRYTHLKCFQGRALCLGVRLTQGLSILANFRCALSYTRTAVLQHVGISDVKYELCRVMCEGVMCEV